MKFRKKPVVVEARGPLLTSEMVTTAHGRVRAEAGDYVLTDRATGDTWPIKPDIFAATYEPADQPASAPGAIPTPDRFRGWLQTWIDTTARPCDCRAEIQELLKACQTPETVIVKHRSGCAAWTIGHPQRWQEGDEQQCDCGAADFVKAETRAAPPPETTESAILWPLLGLGPNDTLGAAMKRLSELREIATRLQTLDWTIGYELTEPLAVELDAIRDLAFKVTTPA